MGSHWPSTAPGGASGHPSGSGGHPQSVPKVLPSQWVPMATPDRCRWPPLWVGLPRMDLCPLQALHRSCIYFFSLLFGLFVSLGDPARPLALLRPSLPLTRAGARVGGGESVAGAGAGSLPWVRGGFSCPALCWGGTHGSDFQSWGQRGCRSTERSQTIPKKVLTAEP